MRTIFNPGIYSRHIDLVLLLLRLAVGVLMLSHGLGKFAKLIGDEPVKFADPIGVGVVPSLALAVFAEVFCSILLIFGLATRLAAVPLAFTMLVAVFIVHGGDDFAKKELALVYAIIYTIIMNTGAGRFSLDQWIFNKIKRT